MDSATINRFVGVFVVVLSPFAAYHAWRSITRGPVHLTAPVDVDAVVETFRRRRQIFSRAMTAALTGFAYAFLLIAYGHPVVLGAPIAIHIAVAFVIIGAGIAVASLVYRCPACGSPPWTRMADGSLGVSVNPDRCPSCGTRLR